MKAAVGSLSCCTHSPKNEMYNSTFTFNTGKGLADLKRFLQGGLTNFRALCGLGNRLSDAVKLVMGRGVK